MWYQKLSISLCIIFLGILIYLSLSPKEHPNYKKEFEGIQVRIDSVYKKLNYEKRQVDSFVIVREHYKETKEIEMEQIQRLPLDSAVNLLRKNIGTYEENNTQSSFNNRNYIK